MNGPRHTVTHGDSRRLLAEADADTLDSCVCDPPYELGFMGRRWDQSGIAFDPEFWTLVLRALKPGAHLIAFGGDRTVHRLTCAVEDAGFEIRHQGAWVSAQSFPKSLDVAKNGAKEFEGWGTALKTMEPWILARKPISERSIAANVQRWGTGALNVDGCRLPYLDHEGPPVTELGRWPSAVICADDDGMGGYTKYFRIPGTDGSHDEALSSLVVCPKASTSEREEGLERFEPRQVTDGRREAPDNPRQRGQKHRRNVHTTVKPVALLRHLARLVTPPGGTVLDPFAGSGSCGVAAVWEGFAYEGIELLDTPEQPYVSIARARVSYARRTPPPELRCQPPEGGGVDERQLGLFFASDEFESAEDAA